MPRRAARRGRRSGDQGCAQGAKSSRRSRAACSARRSFFVDGEPFWGTRPLRPGRALARDGRLLDGSTRQSMAEYTLHCFAQSGQLLQGGADARARRRRLGAALRRLFRRRDAHAGLPRHQRDGRGAGARARGHASLAIGRHPRLSRRNASPRSAATATTSDARSCAGCCSTTTSSRATRRPIASCARSRRTPSPPCSRSSASAPRRRGASSTRTSTGREFVGGRPADDRGPLAVRLPVLRRRDRRRLERDASGDRGLARAHPCAAALGRALRADAGPSAARSRLESLDVTRSPCSSR